MGLKCNINKLNNFDDSDREFILYNTFVGESDFSKRKVRVKIEELALKNGYSEEDLDFLETWRDYKDFYYSCREALRNHNDSCLDLTLTKKKSIYLVDKVVPHLSYLEGNNFIYNGSSYDMLSYIENKSVRFNLVVGDFGNSFLTSTGKYMVAEATRYLKSVKNVLSDDGILLWMYNEENEYEVEDILKSVFKDGLCGFIYTSKRNRSKNDNIALAKDSCKIALIVNSPLNKLPFIEVVEKDEYIYYRNNSFYTISPWSESNRTPLLLDEIRKETNIRKHFYTILVRPLAENKNMYEYKLLDDFDYEKAKLLIDKRDIEGLSNNFKESKQKWEKLGYKVFRPNFKNKNIYNLRGFSKEYNTIDKFIINMAKGRNAAFAYINNGVKEGFYNLSKIKNKNLIDNNKSLFENDGDCKKINLVRKLRLKNNSHMKEELDCKLSIFSDTSEYIKGNCNPDSVRSIEMWKELISHLHYKNNTCNVLDLSSGLGQLEKALMQLTSEKLNFHFLACELDADSYESLKINLNDYSIDYLEVDLKELDDDEFISDYQNNECKYVSYSRLKHMNEQSKSLILSPLKDIKEEQGVLLELARKNSKCVYTTFLLASKLTFMDDEKILIVSNLINEGE